MALAVSESKRLPELICAQLPVIHAVAYQAKKNTHTLIYFHIMPCIVDRFCPINYYADILIIPMIKSG